jgi:hypothetical protein
MDQAEMYDDDLDEVEEIEAYCVSCRQMVVMENPTPVWTRRGRPGTRGVCEVCGGNIFRMGRTPLHGKTSAPDLSGMEKITGQTRYAAFIAYADADAALAARLADDLPKMGVPVWLADEDTAQDDTRWAGGAHPALLECSHMIVVLSEDALGAPEVAESWAFFKGQHKPVVVALAGPCEVPDDLRRSPRFDFTGEYKPPFRRMLQALAR